MKRTLGVLMAAILLLSLQVFASADDSTAVRTTDEVTVTDAGVLILTEDGLAISYACPTENVAAVTQDLDQQTLLYLLLYSSGLKAKAAKYIEDGIHLNIYDFDSGTDIYLYTEETVLSMLVPNLTAMSEDDVAVIQNYLKNNEFDEADSITAGMIGNNIKRDVLGANRFGIRSVLLTWSKRYVYTSDQPDMEPTYRIATPDELLPLVHRLEAELAEAR